ncbi:PREDICTED: beta-defensin 126 [Myotis brandtii]|uniref:beta-defensin 126 n=1 Tax=Myotis brandtii TaxID=109478 RepID=UPI0003BBF6A1|nr:PREDICTED: beta-defensin 126 [Myotis brandtii]
MTRILHSPEVGTIISPIYRRDDRLNEAGNWMVKKCANKNGNCRSKCRTGELQIKPHTGMCIKEKMCCVLNGKELNPFLCRDHHMTTTAGPITTNAPEEEETTMTGGMTAEKATAAKVSGAMSTAAKATTASPTTASP